MRIRKSRSPWLIATIGILLSGVRTARSEPYTASFQTPVIQLNKTASVGYQVNLTVAQPSISDLSIALCQTSDKTSVNGTNSWQVLNLLSGLCLTSNFSPEETCKNNPFKGRQYMQLTLFKNALYNSTGDDSLDNFFFCVTHGATISSSVCDYISDIFAISPAVAGTKPVDLDSSLNLIPTLFPTPTPASITITSTRSTVLQTPTSASTLLTSTTVPTTKDIQKKKGLSTASQIGIAFGVFSLFLVFGLIGLVILRRSSARKRTQAAHSLNVKSFQNSNFKIEKDNSESPTSPPGWVMGHRAQDRSDIPELAAPVPATLTSQTMSTSKGGSDSGFHLRDLSRRKSSMKRNSLGSVSISPIPSLRSEPLYESYRNDDAQNTMKMNREIGMASTAPFLREEGMSPEEIARLEDEERRIDAAIAAAEAERALGRR